MSEKMELEPCPFCGGKAKSFAPYPELRRYWTVECASCAASVSGEIDSKQDDATAAWNRRDPARIRVRADWMDGAPTKPFCDEWFIAETTYGDRVVLRALPEEYAYDFKTADETYFKADKIKRWMQFPDSTYKSATEARADALAAKVEGLEKALGATLSFVEDRAASDDDYELCRAARAALGSGG